MAKAILNPAIMALRGKVGDLVYRWMNGQQVIQRAPKPGHRHWSRKQKLERRRFADDVAATRRWLKDPRHKAACRRKVVAGDTVFGVAMHVRHQRRARA